MRTGRPKAPLVLTEAERATVESLATRARTRPHLARRARIILLCSQGLASTVVARRLHTRAQTIGKWRGRFFRRRRGGLFEETPTRGPRADSTAEVDSEGVRERVSHT